MHGQGEARGVYIGPIIGVKRTTNTIGISQVITAQTHAPMRRSLKMLRSGEQKSSCLVARS